MNVWQGTLHTTGGALDYKYPNKSCWYGVDYEWNNSGRWKHCEYNDVKLMIYDDEGNKMEVLYCQSDEAHRTLGVMLAPNDNNRSQVDSMRNISLKFGDRVRVGFIRGHDVFHALNNTVMRSLIYPLPAITLI